MKKLIILGSAFIAFLAGAAFAGDYHSGATLNCAECHVLHYSETHGLNADGSGTNVAKGSAGPYDYLLRNHVNELCLTCHDNQTFAPDVLAANGGNTTANGRLAGGLNEPGTEAAGYYAADGHTLGATAAAPGATTWTNSNGLDCVDCHTQHGRAFGSVSTYRNLNLSLGGGPTSLSYAIGTNDITKDAYEVSAATGGNHYDNENVNWNEPTSTASNYGLYCGQCHTNFHGSATSTNMRNQAGPAGTEWYRHPTADVNIGVAGGGHSSISRAWGLRAYRVKVMSAAGNWGTQGTALGAAATGDWTPSCMSCHKAHGNQNAYGLIFATGTANPGENGDGANYMALCRQCHVQ